MKVIRDGNVAVLISTGYGAGWYTWNEESYKDIVEWVENDKKDEDELRAIVQRVLNLNEDDYICLLGADDLKIEWIEQGTNFIIEEYDGNESIGYLDSIQLIA